MPRKMKKHGDAPPGEPQAKRMRLLSDDENDSGADDSNGAKLSINQDFAKRFEHNKQREERQRLEEKYGKTLGDEDDDSSTSEEEDDAADLATAELDAEIFDTLDAIKKKDPRVYDKDATFYTPFDPDTLDQAQPPKKEKPMYLTDYHRQNLLEGNVDPGADDQAPAPTYAQEQQALKDDLINQMHAAAEDQEGGDNNDDDDDDFFTRKPRPVSAKAPSASRPKITEIDIKTADKDPENFLSNFMASRAWVPEESSRFAALDSDDSDDERRAEEFEAAYNLRFEDPAKANEKLMTFSRDVAKLSVRREDKSGRKKLREKEREKKDQAKRERDEDKARLRKLKIDEVEEKVKKIKEAAGLRNEALDLTEWKQVLNEDWDDDQWDQEMKRRFGDNYYADQEAAVASDDEDGRSTTRAKKPKKPSWDDDIDIKDLVPEFSDDEDGDEDEDEDMEMAEGGDGDDTTAPDGSSRPKSKKDRLKAQADKRRVARKERMAVEELVDADLTATLPSTSKTPGFRYRETSPTTFGLTTRDILFADDGALNTFAGLKKMAAWRDEDKKKRDKKKLGKKARLRQWRKETFGDEEGFRGGFREFLGEEGGAPATEGGGANPEQGGGGSRKRRGKKRKAETVES